jgi:hypothetical protein
VRLKAILRQNTPGGIRMLPIGTRVVLTVRTVRNRLVDERTITLTAWSSADWTMTLPPGWRSVITRFRAILESDRPTRRHWKRGGEASGLESRAMTSERRGRKILDHSWWPPTSALISALMSA